MLVMDVDLADNSLLLFAAVVTVDLSRTYMCIYRVCTMQYENDPSLVPTCTVVYLQLSLSPSLSLYIFIIIMVVHTPQSHSSAPRIRPRPCTQYHHIQTLPDLQFSRRLPYHSNEDYT